MSKSSWLRQAIVVLFHFLLIATPLIFTWWNEELFEFSKMLLTYSVTVVLVSLWLGRMVIEKRWLWRRTFLDIPIGVFLGSQILSTLFSIHPYTSIFGYYTRFHGGLLSTISYILIFYVAINNLKRTDLPKLFLTTLITAFGVSLYGISEHFGHSPSCWLITQGKINDDSCWIQDVQTRVFATFGQPNWLAAYVIMLIPLSLVLSLDRARWCFNRSWVQLFYGLTTVVMFVLLLFTQSRSGFLGLALGGVTLVGGWLWLTFSQKQAPTTLIRPAIIGLCCAGVALIWGTPYSPSVVRLLAHSSTANQPTAAASPQPTTNAQPQNRLEEGGSNSGDIRKVVWTGALRVWQRYPLLGSGVETFAYSYYLDRPVAHNLLSEWDFLYNKAHNEFLNFLATTGAVGLGAYVALLGGFAWLFISSIRTTPRSEYRSEQELGVAFLAALGGLSVSNFFGFSTVMVTILMYLMPAWLIIQRQGTTEKTSGTEAELTATSYIELAGIAVVALYLLYLVHSFYAADKAYALGKALIQSQHINEGVNQLQQAVLISPNEALFYDELADTYAQLAVGFAKQGLATESAQLAAAAVRTSDKTLELNSRHMNFYKTRARIFITLAQLDPQYLDLAVRTLQAAMQLSPTDPKLIYNLAQVHLSQGQKDQAFQEVQRSVELKPNYEAARFLLGQLLAGQGNYQGAAEQYQYILSTIDTTNQDLKNLLQTTLASASAQPKAINKK